MDDSFYTRLKRVCHLGDGDSFGTDDSDTDYNPEADPEVTALLFASDSDDSDFDDVPSDDSAVVDLSRLSGKGSKEGQQDGIQSGVTHGSVSDRLQMSATLADDAVPSSSTQGSQSTAYTTRPRRRTYESTLRKIAQFNAAEVDSDDDEIGSNDAPESDTDDDVEWCAQNHRPKRSRVSHPVPGSRGCRRGALRGTRGTSQTVTAATQSAAARGGLSSDESDADDDVERPKRSQVSHRARGSTGRRRGAARGTRGTSQTVTGATQSAAARGGFSGDANVHGRRRVALEQQAEYYSQRPMVGARRRHEGPSAGPTQNNIFYGPGTILDDNWMQPRDSSFPPVKIMPEGYGWRGRPKRQSHTYPFTPNRPPGIYHLNPVMTCTELFEEFWREPKDIWKNATNEKGAEMCAKSGATFREVTEADVRSFLACKLWIDLFRKPSLRLYWSEVKDFCSPFIIRARESTGMSHRRFQQIKLWTRLYNKALATQTGMCNVSSRNYDVSHKAREYINALNRNCEKFREPGTILSLDESMAEYTGIGGEKQTIKSKPTPTGLMFYALNTPDGYFVRLLLHAKQTLPYWEEMGIPFATVFSILSGAIGGVTSNYLDTGRTVITDRAYTSVSIAYALAFRNTHFIGTVKRALKCVPKGTVMQKDSKGELKEVMRVSKTAMDRGDVFFLHDTEGVLSFCGWQDSKLVPVIYNHPFVEEMVTCKRLLKGGDRGGTEIGRPKVLEEYDRGMGGVDLGDQHMAAQHRPTRCYVWYTPILFRSFDVIANNVFCVKTEFGYRMLMLEVKLSLAYGFLQRAQTMVGYTPSVIPDLASAFHKVHHYPFAVSSRLRQPCTECRSKVSTGCETCHVYCHLNDCWKKHVTRCDNQETR